MTFPVRMPGLIPALAVMIGLVTAASPANAQYFGQNKVQYDEFDFKVLETEHFDIYYYPQEKDAAVAAGRMAERWYGRLSTLLGHQLSSRQPVVLYASHPEFEQTNVIEGLISEATGGVTEGGRRRVILPLAASLGETDHILGHELVHAFQYDILGPAIERAPLWFIEGMAEYLSLGPRHPQTAMWLRDSAMENDLPDIGDLYNPRYFPYRFGHAFWAFIGGRWGDEAVGATLRRLAPGNGGLDPVQALETQTKLDDKVLAEQWHASIFSMYDIVPREKKGDEDEETLPPALLAERTGSGSMNIGPSLSPDGTKIAFLSERSQLSIDIHVADAKTGKVIRRLTSSAVDPHFESLQFLASSGSWAPDNRRLVIASVQKGRGNLTIFDTANGDIEKNIPLEERGEIFQPTWSPDGQSIAFVAQVGGFTDLFVHTLSDGKTRRLTEDAFADLQPQWSPDGQQLLFLTDRFGSNLETLSFSPARLALMTVSDARITEVKTDVRGEVSSPQWAPDGASVYYISDASGRPDVYRTTLASGQSVPLTAEATGVSGITPLSPALSVARTTGQAAVSIYRDGGYEIRYLDPAAPPITLTTQDMGRLPPADRQPSVVARQLETPAAPPSAAEAPTERPYSSGLTLVGIGQEIGASTSGAFGTYVSGGISMLFSDILGNHLVPITVGINGRVKDISAQASYINRTKRWNWGVFGEHVPLRSGFVQAGLDIIDGRAVYLEETDLLRETQSQFGGLIAYPFSRTTRVEMSAALRRIGFSRERQTLAFDANTGAFLFEDIQEIESLPSLRLADTTVALVRDRTANGAVGPVLGQRFRFEVTPTFGDLRMTSTTLDFRQYAMPFRPVTFAMRAMHVGRYGSSGEDERLFPLFLGYPTLVRGYDAGSFEAGECTPAPDGSCPEFDRLRGSRLFVFNGEARVPLFGLFTGNLDYGPVPTELFGFFDTGVAWNDTERPVFANGTRPWVSSVGAGVRVNAFGYAVLELNAARALDRPGRGWMFVFNMRPAF